MDKPTSRIFFSFPVMLSRVICKGFLSDNVLTAYLAGVGKRHLPLPSLINEFCYVTSTEYGVNIWHRTEANWARNSNHRDALCWSASSCYIFHSIQPHAIKTRTCRDCRQLRSRPDAMPKEQVEGVLSVISKEARENYESLNKAVSTQNSNIIRGAQCLRIGEDEHKCSVRLLINHGFPKLLWP